MEIRFEHSPKEVSGMNTRELRDAFLVSDTMIKDEINYMYSHYDRVIMGGVVPVTKSLSMPNHPELKADYFLERREIGIINVGGSGRINVDSISYEMEKLSCLYLGKGTRQFSFSSNDSSNPALFFFLSSPAHHAYPNTLVTKEEADPVALGDAMTSNKRTIYKYIHPEGIKSCQLVMGVTALEPGSVWNSIPPHTHTRRMEAYFYFDLPEEHRVFHYMGEPTETRHLLIKNHEAVISPPWSVHFGSGTSNYSFIWGMAGENQRFNDMDALKVSQLK